MARDTHAGRNQRLRDALRENLKRRKAQAKGRAVAAEPVDDDTSDRHGSGDCSGGSDSKPST